MKLSPISFAASRDEQEMGNEEYSNLNFIP